LPPENASVEEKATYSVKEKAFITNRNDIYQKIRSVYHYFRGLCEDVNKIEPVTEEPVVICAEVDLHPGADPEWVQAKIMSDIDDYLSPPLYFYSLQEMVADQRPSQEIFDGPVFDFDHLEGFHPACPHPFDRKGFIKKEELANADLRKEIRLSDIVGIMMKVDGVKLVKKIAFGFCSCEIKNGDILLESLDLDQWILCIPGNKFVKPTLCRENSVFRFFKDVIPVVTKKEEVETILREMAGERAKAIEEKTTEDLEMPLGTFIDTGNYTTIQNQFPENYGIGQTGLPDTATTERKALAKQLKGYLLFFDQILADYFSQLEKAGVLLTANDRDHKTYFGNMVAEIKDIEAVFPDSNQWIESHDGLLKETGLDPYTERKNRFLDHLLARFAEQFNEYVLMLYSVYGKEANRAVIRYKTAFLNDLQEISLRRGCGFDYFNTKTKALESVNLTGLEKRLARLLGFPGYVHPFNRALPYKVFPFENSLQQTKYTWEVRKENQVILRGSDQHDYETDAYKELNRAAVACQDRHFYNTWYSVDKSLVSFYVTDHVLTESEGSSDSSISFTVADGNVDPGNLQGQRPHVVAFHPLCYPASPDPGTGIANEILEKAIGGFIEYFTHDFIFEEKHKDTDEIWVVEHLLLRPDTKFLSKLSSLESHFMPVCIDPNGIFCPPLDPYSCRISVVLPGYTLRMRNPDFRKFVERLIRLETPAHILPRICFVPHHAMVNFRAKYHTWRKEIEDFTSDQRKDQAIAALIRCLTELYTVYEEGQLIDCDDDTIERNPLVLNRTHLGTL
jgi:hypothetical protein